MVWAHQKGFKPQNLLLALLQQNNNNNKAISFWFSSFHKVFGCLGLCSSFQGNVNKCGEDYPCLLFLVILLENTWHDRCNQFFFQINIGFKQLLLFNNPEFSRQIIPLSDQGCSCRCWQEVTQNEERSSHRVLRVGFGLSPKELQAHSADVWSW